jgi:DNA-binding transcriptional ArsR family regulator
MARGMDDVYKAMADPHRRSILGQLCRQSHEAGELARMVGLAPNAVSFHLRALKAADLVSVRREGRFLRYSLEPDSLLTWRDHVDRLFPSHLVAGSASAKRSNERADSLEAGSYEGSMSGGDQLPTELL